MANTLEIVVKAKDQASGTLRGIDSTLRGLSGVGKVAFTAAAAGAVALAGAAIGAGAAMLSLAKAAMPLEGISAAFQSITDNGDEMLAMLRKGTAGMVTDVDLMKSYNLAAQLVGKTFADDLPNAMGYLTKVSAATGTSMDYLMDSLVRGVGRLSPLILDNLGVSIKLEDAYTAYAASIGKATDELTKEEQQAAVMNATMEALAKNTEKMPDMVGSATASWAALGAQWQNAKQRIGTALLPAIQGIAGPLAAMIDKVMPMFERFAQKIPLFFEERIIPAVVKLVDVFGLLADGNIQGALGALFSPEVGARIFEIATAIGAFIAQVSAFVSEHAEAFKAALTAIGALLGGSMIYTAITAIVAAIAAISWPIVLIIAAVALLAAAWAEDWGGIQEKTQAVIDWITPYIQAALNFIQQFWDDNGEQIVASVSTAWEWIKSAFSAGAEIVEQIVGVALAAIQAWWAEHGAVVMAVINTIWETIKTIFNMAVENIKLLLLAFHQAIEGDWYAFGETMRQIVDNIWIAIVDIFTRWWETLKIVVKEIVDGIVAIWESIDWSAVGQGIVDGVKNGVKAAAVGLASAAVEAIKAALAAARGFLGIKSPSKLAAKQIGVPFVEGIGAGMDKAMRSLTAIKMPQLTAQLVGAGQSGMGAASNRTTNQTYNLNVYTNAQSEPIIADFNMMRAFAG